ncbi:MAG: hypothetical protein ABI626_10580 [Sphingomicrobium sp.]
MSLALSLALSFLISAAAQPQPQPQTVDQNTVNVIGSKPGLDEVICQKVPQLGSRLIVKSVCATRSQWAQREQDDKAYVNDVARNALLWNSPPH